MTSSEQQDHRDRRTHVARLLGRLHACHSRADHRGAAMITRPATTILRVGVVTFILGTVVTAAATGLLLGFAVPAMGDHLLSTVTDTTVPPDQREDAHPYTPQLLYPEEARRLVLDRLTNEDLIAELSARLDDGFWLDDVWGDYYLELNTCRSATPSPTPEDPA